LHILIVNSRLHLAAFCNCGFATSKFGNMLSISAILAEKNFTEC